jgi:ABC-type Fe3+-hydroxamate transport system substrate-binding protein
MRVGKLNKIIQLILFTAILLGFSPVLWAKSVALPRVVSLKPNITMNLIELGAEDTVVGMTKYCPKPNESAKVIGDYNSVDIEAVIRLQPDLIVTSTENSQSRQFAALKKAGFKIQLLDYSSLAQMKQSFLKLGELVGKKLEATQVIAGMDSKLEQLKKEQSLHRVPQSFIVLVQRRPLMVAASGSFVSNLFEEAGLKNAFGKNAIHYPVMDEEEFIREIVTYTFELVHDAKDFEPEFFNKTVTPLKMQHYYATPKAIDTLAQLLK